MDAEAAADRTISAVVRAVVARAAPEELSIVDGLSAASDEEIVARLSRRPGRDEQLGFGWDDVAVLVTPLLYIVLDQGLRTIVDGALGRAGRRVRRLTRRRATPTVPELSPQQIADIRARFADLAREHGVSEEKIEQVGDAVTAVLKQPADGPDGPDGMPPDDRGGPPS